MIKESNKRIAITLSINEIKILEKLSEYTGFSKSVLIKQAISDLIKMNNIDEKKKK